MERRMKISVMALFALTLFCQTALAQQSQLELGLDDTGRIFVTDLFDDDSSIESLEIFVLDEGTEHRFHYDNVLEGQVLGVSFRSEEGDPGFSGEKPGGLKAVFAEGETQQGQGSETQFTDPETVYYNFFDADGAVTNSKFFVYLKETNQEPEVKNVNRTSFFHPLTSKTVNARKDLTTGNYFLDVTVTGNRIDSTTLEYYFSDFTQKQTLELSKAQEGIFVGTLGPFNSNLSIALKVIVQSGRFSHEYLFGKREFGALGPQLDRCNGFSNTLTKNNSFQKSNTALLQIFQENFKYATIRIIEDESAHLAHEGRTFRVMRVFDDDDQKIDFVEFIAETPDGETKHYEFQKVGQGDEIVIQTPVDSKVYYNYMDFTDKYSGINYFLPVKKQDVLEMPFFTATDRKDMLNQAKVEVVPNSDCSSFSLKVNVMTNGVEAKTYLRYGFSENSRPYFIELPKGTAGLKDSTTYDAFLQGENNYELEIPIGGGDESQFFAEIYSESIDGEFDNLDGLNQWVGFFEGEEEPQEEVCGNEADDDADGEIDEDCLFFPDLFFVETGIQDLFVSNETNIATAVVKNAGLTNSLEFEVAFYLNDLLVGQKKIEGVLQGEQKIIEIEFIPPEGLTGIAEARLAIDPANQITELDELNNFETKQVVIGKNSFKVVPNFNQANFLGDLREVRVFDVMGKPVEGAQVTILLPSGKTKTSITNVQGVGSFLLEESGAHSIKVTKDGFEDFEGAFRVPVIVISGLKTQYALGETLKLSIITEEGQSIQDFIANITTPLNETRTVSSTDFFQLSAPGSYRIEITRNNVRVGQATFVVSGLVESIVFEGILSSLIGGELIKDTPLFLFLLLLSAIAAYLVFSKQELLFGKPQYDTTSQKRLRLVAKLVTAFAALFLPFVTARFLGFNAGTIVAIAEILAVLFLEFKEKRAKQRKPFGF